jgi:hypothetical protein
VKAWLARRKKRGRSRFASDGLRLLSCLLCAALFSSVASTAFGTELSGSVLSVFRKPDASDCPESAALARAVLALGSAPNQPTSQLRIEVTFERNDDGYSATVNSFGSKPGVRRLAMAGKGCEPLAEAVSVTLAVLLDLIPSPEKKQHTSDRETVAPTVENTSPPFVLEMAARAGVAYGALGPAISGVFSPGLRLSRERFQLLGSAFWNTPNSTDYRDGFVRVGLWGGGIDACFRLGPSDRTRLGFLPCAGFRLGRLSGKGVQFDENYQAAQTWVALNVSGGARLALSKKWGFVASLSAIVPAKRHSFSVSGAGTAFESQPLAGLLEIGPEVQIW